MLLVCKCCVTVVLLFFLVRFKYCAAIPYSLLLGSTCFFTVGGLFNSTIIGGDVSYQSSLSQFLMSAVGLDPKWVLCYRASSHGWDVSNFHSRCDGKRDTVTIIKRGQYVFGGYTDIPWGIINSLFQVIQY